MMVSAGWSFRVETGATSKNLVILRQDPGKAVMRMAVGLFAELRTVSIVPSTTSNPSGEGANLVACTAGNQMLEFDLQSKSLIDRR